MKSKEKKKNIPRFDPQTYEEDVRKKWESDHVYQTKGITDAKDKEYILVMFPYPSGDGLHTGHARIYCGTDVLARYYRMQGKSVLHPMGWDAFGLPAENQAIKKQTNPKKIVPDNINNFKNQFRQLGVSYDWDKEINTTDPNYYAITQKLFIEFFKHGLLYKKNTPVYYCPSCKTGIAQEEVEGDGRHERCGNKVEKRNLDQWMFRITEYSDSLLQGLKDLDWPKGILEMQKNWIGKKQGVEITYPIDGTDEEVTCFTTRPDTNHGATFVVLAPEHALVDKILKGDIQVGGEASQKDIESYVHEARTRTERERKAEEKNKTGIFTGLYAINRLNGEKLPVWVSDFVLHTVGTGAVVGVPAHDKRDFEFAAKFNLKVKRVVKSPDGNEEPISNVDQVYEDYGVAINSGDISGMKSGEAINTISDMLEKNEWGTRTVDYHLRDWIFSRQRYWGEPIPMVYCDTCAQNKVSYWNTDAIDKGDLHLERHVGEGFYSKSEGVGEGLEVDTKPQNSKSFADLAQETEEKVFGWFPLEYEELPLTLPDIEKYEPTESGESPLSELDDWKNVTCPVCGSQAERETDTMPNWAGSCWYFLAYPIAEQIRSGESTDLTSEAVQNWMPVDWYVGGAEHAVLHLLYARFWMHALNDLGSMKFREPFTRLRNVGMLHAEDGTKMSKSKGNVVNPDDVISEYGADALRVYEMFMAPFDMEIAWSVQSLQGSYRFIKRIWHIYNSSDKIANGGVGEQKELASELQITIEKVTEDIPNVKYNTPIAHLMKFLNKWEEKDAILSKSSSEAFLKLIAPYAPFITDYIWSDILGNEGSIHNQQWPKVNRELIAEKSIKLPVQVNGKVRGTIMVEPGTPEGDVVSRALEQDAISKWIGDSTYKVIYIQDKILNFVLK